MSSRQSCALLFILGVILTGICGPASAPGQSGLPKELAGVVPKNAVNASGMWSRIVGSLSAEIVASHPCTTSKSPGRLNVQLVYQSYGILLPQSVADQEQSYADKKQQLERDLTNAAKNPLANVMHEGPLKSEDGPGGKLVYYDKVVDCSEGKHQERPEVRLFAVSRADRLFAKIEITGNLSGEEAKAVATEVMGNLSKVDVSAMPRK